MKPFLPMMLLAMCTLAACSADGHKHHEPASHAGGVDPVAAMVATGHPGAKVYQSACMKCHAASGGEEGVAPPIFAVKDHLVKVYPEKAAFVARVVGWVKKPNADDVLMPGAVGKFGLMPAMPEISQADLQAVAEFLYDTDFGQPEWYKAHYQAEHGKKH